MNRKERKIKYLGFDDRYFVLVGVVVLSMITTVLFNRSVLRSGNTIEIFFNWLISLFFATVNWLTIREVLILLRKRYPNLEDILKRGVLFFFTIVIIVTFNDYIGNGIIA
ncbi:MAG: histidine kinase, partial [Bacteroidota bacterium]